MEDFAFPHEGPFGSYDTMQLQRGLQVYTEILLGLSWLKFVAFRTWLNPVGPSFPKIRCAPIRVL